MQVSVIIINYNTLKLTDQTIESILKKTKDVDFEIILVDNNSKDGSYNYFSKKYENQIKIIKNLDNIGFGRANNKGIKISKGKYIFLLNSDTILINNAIKILYDFMERNTKIGIVGGNLYDEEMKPAISYELNLPSNKLYLEKLHNKIIKKQNKYFNETDKPLKVGYVSGANMMIRKKALEGSGVFDADFFMYYEETELTSRIKKNGYLVYNVPQAKIIHLEGKSFDFKEKRERMILESRHKYFKKVYGINSMKLAYYLLQIEYLKLFLFKQDKKYLKLANINKETYRREKGKI